MMKVARHGATVGRGLALFAAVRVDSRKHKGTPSIIQ
jgi:hypothetical protein